MLKISIGINQDGFETALKQMPSPLTFPVEIGCIAHIQPLIGTAQVGFRRFDQEMIVIGHQAVRMHLDAKTFNSFPHVL